ncbi:MAG TPA: MFS transporter [Nitrosarchaeum sp.]|nr:MFS transporter [Nitrosarchaeum sp.]
MQKIQVNNLVRSATFFQHAGISMVFVFMPLIARGVTKSIFEVGLIVASFSFAQILSEIYFGRHSDKKGTRLKFIRIGFIGCALAFGAHYFANDVTALFLVRIAAGVASGIMIPAMIAYTYEANIEKKRAATVISFQALGWLAGIAAAGFANDLKIVFLISAASFLMGLIFTIKLPNPLQEKEILPGTTKKIISKNKFLFLSLLLRHIGATSVWTIFPLMLMEKLGAELYQISIVYVANTLAAFIIMNLMADKINLSNVTKFKIGIGCTTFVFVGLAFITDWWMAMPFMALVGATWGLILIAGNFHLMDNNPRSTSTGIFSSTISIATVVGPVIAGSIAFMFDYVSVMYFAVAIIIVAFTVSLKIKN